MKGIKQKMTKIYKIKVPASMYFQLIAYIILALIQLIFSFRVDLLLIKFMSSIFTLIITVIILVLLIKILRKDNTLEISNDKIKLNNTEVQILKIEKIIIQGYFIQSIGIKLYEKNFVLNDLHFRFKYNEEKNIEEFKEWATKNGITVTVGRINRWI